MDRPDDGLDQPDERLDLPDPPGRQPAETTDPRPEPPLDAVRDGALRRLLAEVRVDEPVPPAVAARLDAVLADLAAGREPAPSGSAAPAAAPTPRATPAPRPSPALDAADELAARRRRRSRALAAAAAVVVLGVGGTVLQGLGGLSGAGDDAMPTSDAGGSAAEEPAAGLSGPESATEERLDSGATSDLESGAQDDSAGEGRFDVPLDRATLADAPALTRAGFVDEVTRLVRSGRVVEQTVPLEAAPEAGDQVGAPTCAVDAGPDDQVLAVRYAGAPALLVVRPEQPTAQGPGQVVDLVVCGREGVARSVLVTR